MPLLDHFHPPLSGVRHWEAFHGRWANAVADALNAGLLPTGYFAEAQVHVGGRVEVDVAAFEGDLNVRTSAAPGVTATLPARAWAPPAAALSMPAVFPDAVEVLVYNTEAGPSLVGAVELVSPGNKDRPEARRAFAAKCATYLGEGVGLIVADVVTSRQANLHNELVAVLGAGDAFLVPPDPLYAVAYRPLRLANESRIDVWPERLGVGNPLPLLPLALDKGLCVPIDLEATYTEARQRSRLA